MEDKEKVIKTEEERESQGHTRYDSQYDEKQSWAEEAKEDLETWIEEQGIYIRQ
jgi:hypothetical protein